MLNCRYYNIAGVKWQACFFHKGETFPDTDLVVPRQGVWGHPTGTSWEEARFLGYSWRFLELDPDLLHMPERSP